MSALSIFTRFVLSLSSDDENAITSPVAVTFPVTVIAPLKLEVPFTSKSKVESGALPTPRFPETLAFPTVVTNPVLSIDSLVALAVTSLI